MLLIPGSDFSQCSSFMFLEFLGNLASHRTLTLCSEKLGELLQGLDQTIWRFVENQRPCLLSKLSQAGLAAFLLRQKAFETESVTRISG